MIGYTNFGAIILHSNRNTNCHKTTNDFVLGQAARPGGGGGGGGGDEEEEGIEYFLHFPHFAMKLNIIVCCF